MARIKVEDREARFKRLRKRRLGGAKKPIWVKGRRSYVEECHYSSEEGDLWIKMDFIPMQIEDSKSLAQNGYAQKNEDVDALMVLVEERTAWS